MKTDYFKTIYTGCQSIDVMDHLGNPEIYSFEGKCKLGDFQLSTISEKISDKYDALYPFILGRFNPDDGMQHVKKATLIIDKGALRIKPDSATLETGDVSLWETLDGWVAESGVNHRQDEY